MKPAVAPVARERTRRRRRHKQEMRLADESKKDKADTEFKKLQRAEEGRRAMSDYEAEAAAERAKTARLKALRLAKEAEEAAKPKPPAPVKKAGKKTKAVPVKLSAWLDGQKNSGRSS